MIALQDIWASADVLGTHSIPIVDLDERLCARQFSMRTRLLEPRLPVYKQDRPSE